MGRLKLDAEAIQQEADASARREAEDAAKSLQVSPNLRACVHCLDSYLENGETDPACKHCGGQVLESWVVKRLDAELSCRS